MGTLHWHVPPPRPGECCDRNKYSLSILCSTFPQLFPIFFFVKLDNTFTGLQNGLFVLRTVAMEFRTVTFIPNGNRKTRPKGKNLIRKQKEKERLLARHLLMVVVSIAALFLPTDLLMCTSIESFLSSDILKFRSIKSDQYADRNEVYLFFFTILCTFYKSSIAEVSRSLNHSTKKVVWAYYQQIDSLVTVT